MLLEGKKSIGAIRSTVIIGPDGVVKKQWAKVAKAEQHPAQVLAYLRGLSRIAAFDTVCSRQ